jgi:hypothetical protein
MRSHGQTTIAVAVVLPIVALALLACAKQQVNMGRGPHHIEPSDYRGFFATWSRTLRVLPIDGLENILTARATYLSHEFRHAYVVRVADDLKLTPAERERMLREEMGAIDRWHEFFVSLMSGVKGCEKLDPEDEVWTIRLKNDRGEEISPLEVIEIKRPTPNDIKYFGFDPSYRKAFRLRFPLTGDSGQPIIPPTTRYFDLSFATAYGTGVVRWEIGPQ